MAARERNLALAEKLVKAMPAAARKAAEVVEKPGKTYTIVKVNGASVASVRDTAVRIVHRVPEDGEAEAVKKFAALIAESAPEPKPDKPAKKPAGKKDDAPAADGEGKKGGDE